MQSMGFCDRPVHVSTSNMMLCQDFLSKVIASSRRGGAGAPLRANDGQVQTRLPMTFSKNERGGMALHTNFE